MQHIAWFNSVSSRVSNVDSNVSYETCPKNITSTHFRGKRNDRKLLWIKNKRVELYNLNPIGVCLQLTCEHNIKIVLFWLWEKRLDPLNTIYKSNTKKVVQIKTNQQQKLNSSNFTFSLLLPNSQYRYCTQKKIVFFTNCIFCCHFKFIKYPLKILEVMYYGSDVCVPENGEKKLIFLLI